MVGDGQDSRNSKDGEQDGEQDGKIVEQCQERKLFCRVWWQRAEVERKRPRYLRRITVSSSHESSEHLDSVTTPGLKLHAHIISLEWSRGAGLAVMPLTSMEVLGSKTLPTGTCCCWTFIVAVGVGVAPPDPAHLNLDSSSPVGVAN